MAVRKTRLDTDILSEYLKGHDKLVVRRATEYGRSQGVFPFTSVSVHEIVSGLAFKGAPAQLGKALAWLRRNEEIEPVAGDFYQAALIRAAARRQGAVVELPDCLIACVAIRLGLPVVTGSTEDFEAIRRAGARITIENWRLEAPDFSLH